MTLPKKLLDKGVTDMVRISDGRMSGTAYGTVVLHVSPESAIGGNLGLVQNGDMIELDVLNKRIHLEVSDEELAKLEAEFAKLGKRYGKLAEQSEKTAEGLEKIGRPIS
jgi:dihydroxyacid dehydratase/phosphogluconate dehydratase